MALAPFCLTDPKYLSFYREAAAAGDRVILDNGAYEGKQVEWKDLIRLAEELEGSRLTIVLPDKPGDWAETWRMGTEFWRQFGGGQPSVKACMILHAADGDLWQFIEGYKRITAKFSWIGFSRLTKSYGSPGETTTNRRVAFAKGLQKIGLWDNRRFHHAFGMLKGCVDELPLLSGAGFYGCDSSAPVWRGLHGFRIRNRGWINVPFSSQIQNISTENVQTADLNLQEVLAACK